VSRIDDLDLDLVASLELETNQEGSGFIWTNDSKNIEMKVDQACVCSKRCDKSVQITWSIVRETTSDREDKSTVDKRYNSKKIQQV
jgi:hypothetical protein